MAYHHAAAHPGRLRRQERARSGGDFRHRASAAPIHPVRSWIWYERHNTGKKRIGWRVSMRAAARLPCPRRACSPGNWPLRRSTRVVSHHPSPTPWARPPQRVDRNREPPPALPAASTSPGNHTETVRHRSPDRRAAVAPDARQRDPEYGQGRARHLVATPPNGRHAWNHAQFRAALTTSPAGLTTCATATTRAGAASRPADICAAIVRWLPRCRRLRAAGEGGRTICQPPTPIARWTKPACRCRALRSTSTSPCAFPPSPTTAHL